MIDNQTPPVPGLTSRLSSARLAWVIPTGIIFIALVLRLAGIDKSLWIDEVSTIRHLQAADFIASLRSDIHPPLYFFLLNAASQVSDSVPWLRLVSALCGVGLVAVCCVFFRGGNRVGGWIAGLLLAALPGLMANSQELRQYALLSLCFGLALFFASRFRESPRSHWMLVGLGGALAAAASTHLITVFFLPALGLVLAWHLRHEPRSVLLRAAGAFIPAACLIAFFRLVFVFNIQPDQWWMPAINLPVLQETFSEASGWNSFRWLADACERNLGHTGIVVMIGATSCTVFALWTAWGRRHAGIAHALLAVALIYWGLMIAYSLVGLPVIWPRTVLPGMVPFVLGLGLGIATHPHAGRRTLATIAVTLLAFFMTITWLRGFAFRPNEDLRGFTFSLKSASQPDSLLILVGEVENGIQPYWPEYQHAHLLRVKMGAPDTLAALTAALDRQPAGARIFLIYRADYYLLQKQAELDAVVAHLANSRSPPETRWEKDGYLILQFNAPGVMP
jgi:predicted membrane-bound mannosyltransferase